MAQALHQKTSKTNGFQEKKHDRTVNNVCWKVRAWVYNMRERTEFNAVFIGYLISAFRFTAVWMKKMDREKNTMIDYFVNWKGGLQRFEFIWFKLVEYIMRAFSRKDICIMCLSLYIYMWIITLYVYYIYIWYLIIVSKYISILVYIYYHDMHDQILLELRLLDVAYQLYNILSPPYCFYHSICLAVKILSEQKRWKGSSWCLHNQSGGGTII